MKLVHNNQYLVSTVDTDNLMLEHQSHSSHCAEYTPMCFQMSSSWIISSWLVAWY